MEQIFAYELIFLLFSFYFFYKLKFSKKLNKLLFRDINIYLPFSEVDIKQMKQAKKENKEAKAFTKDCSIDDYVEFCSSENYAIFESITLFYMCGLMVVVLLLSKNGIVYLLNYSSSPNNVFSEIEKASSKAEPKLNSFNILSSFILICILYTICVNLRKQMFPNGSFCAGLKNWAFYLTLIICTVIFFILQLLDIPFLPLNYSDPINTINNRLEKIFERINKENFTMEFSVNEIFLKTFYALFFGMTVSSLTESLRKNSQLDQMAYLSFIHPDINKNHSYDRASLCLKIRHSLNFIILFILSDYVFDSVIEYLFEYKISSNLKYLSVVLCMGVEFILGIYLIWFYFSFYYMACLQGGHINIMEVLVQKEIISAHNKQIIYYNELIWETMEKIFQLFFVPFLLFLCLINIKLTKFLDGQERSGLFDNLLMVSIYGFMVSKGLLENIKLVVSVWKNRRKKVKV